MSRRWSARFGHRPLPDGRGSDNSAGRFLKSCEIKRPPAGVGRLKPAPPMQASYLPLVAQAVSPATFFHSFYCRGSDWSTISGGARGCRIRPNVPRTYTTAVPGGPTGHGGFGAIQSTQNYSSRSLGAPRASGGGARGRPAVPGQSAVYLR